MDISGIVGSQVGQAQGSATKLADDFDTFLTLLTTQLQMQDPLEPVDSSEFTNQLVQFTGVEQSIQTNKNLENISALTAFNGMTASVSFIGKDVTVEQSQASLLDGEATWIYELPSNAFTAEIQIWNDLGSVVKTIDGETAAGSHGYAWDGVDDNGNQLPDGTYSFDVRAEDSNGKAIGSNIFMRGFVQGVEMEGGESLLSVGGFRIPLTSVVAVT